MNSIRSESFFFFALILLGVFLRVHGLEEHYFAGDELGTLGNYNSDKSFFEILGTSFYDLYPPLFNIAIWSVFNVFGESLITARSLPIFFSILQLPFIFLITSKLSTRFGGYLALILCATSLYLITSDQLIRPYSITLFFNLVSFYYAICYQKEGQKKDLKYFLISSILGLYCYFFSIIGFLHCLWILRQRMVDDWKANKKWLVVFGLLTLPLAINALSIAQSLSFGKWHWISEMTSNKFKDTFFWFFASSTLFFIILFSFFLHLLWLFLMKDSKAKEQFSVGFFSLGFLGFVFFVEYLTRPFIEARFIAWFQVLILVQFSMTVAYFFEKVIFDSKIKVLFLSLVTGVSVYHLFNHFDYYHTPQDNEANYATIKKLNQIGLPVACLNRHPSGLKRYYQIDFGAPFSTVQSHPQIHFAVLVLDPPFFPELSPWIIQRWPISQSKPWDMSIRAVIAKIKMSDLEQVINATSVKLSLNCDWGDGPNNPNIRQYGSTLQLKILKFFQLL